MNGTEFKGESAACMQLIIPAKVSQLRVQGSILNADVTKDVFNLIDRVRAIGCRLNSINHPDSRSKISVDPSNKLSDEPAKMNADGLEGDLNNVIDENQNFIDNWNNNLYADLSKYIGYIESHI